MPSPININSAISAINNKFQKTILQKKIYICGVGKNEKYQNIKIIDVSYVIYNIFFSFSISHFEKCFYIIYVLCKGNQNNYPTSVYSYMNFGKRPKKFQSRLHIVLSQMCIV